MAHKRRPLVENPREIGLLASPARIEIVDTLEALGSDVSVAELAARLGRPADGLYYHLRQLAAGGLIEETDGVDGRRYRTRSRGGERLSLRYRPGATPNARAVSSVVTSVLRVAKRDFDRALADPGTVVEGARRELWASRGKAWVSTTELEQINRLLVQLAELLRRPRKKITDGKLIALAWVLAPLEAKPVRRARQG